MATIGQSLTAPESGWQRFDDDNTNITYDSSITASSTLSSSYNGKVHYLPANKLGIVMVKFNFTGDKIRIIVGRTNSTYSNDLIVNIDGSIIEHYSNYSSSVVYQALVYEKTGLSNEEHFLTITNNTNTTAIFDAVDISSTGQLKPYSVIDRSTRMYLIQDKNYILYNYNGTNIIQSPSQTLDDTNFITNGINDLTAIPQSAWASVFPNITDAKVLMWTDDMTKTEAKLVYNCDQFNVVQWLKDNQCSLLAWTDDITKTKISMTYDVSEPYKPLNKLNDDFDILLYKA